MKVITRNDFEKAITNAKIKVNNIPDGKCRIKERAYNNALVNEIKNIPERKAGKIRSIVHVETQNFGTSKYPDTYEKVCEDWFSYYTETEKTYKRKGEIIKKSYVLALIKE